MFKKVKKNFKTLKGEIIIPSDKSMSHRAIFFSSLAKGKSVIRNFSDAQDPLSSLNICRQLGVNIEKEGSTVTVISNGQFEQPYKDLNCENSGTTMRLMAGILAGQNFNTTLIGDSSLSKRPMKRIIEPLTLMGANIDSNKNRAPLRIFGTNLSAIEYHSPISSAQVKSCLLLAGLNADGITKITEPYTSRNHSELLLKHMGANIKIHDNNISIEKSDLKPIDIDIFGDISSAAFFITAGLVVPHSEIILRNVGLNPTRAGIIEIVKKMNGEIEILDERNVCGETVGDIRIKYSPNLKGCEISGEIIPRLIDEIPVIAVLATQAEGQTVIKDAQDLRNKESDRVSTVVTELKKLGANIEEAEDGMVIQGKTELKGDCVVESYHDHRLAMSLYVAGLITKEEICINDFEWVNISFPKFESLFNSIYFS